MIRTFFEELDSDWGQPPEPLIHLLTIGSGALMLQTNHTRATNDGDVLETVELSPAIRARLTELAGRGTTIHARTGIYLDIVGSGIPFLPLGPVWREVTELEHLRCFRVRALDVVDVVVAKLKRLHANDLDDIEEMVSRNLVPHARLIERFKSAYDLFAGDARAAQLPRYVKNLNQIERDILAAPETEFDLEALRY